MTFNFGLSTKINAIIVVAVTLPLILLGVLMFQTVSGITITNLERSVTENGTRRESAIQRNIQTTLSNISEFIAVNGTLMNLQLEVESDNPELAFADVAGNLEQALNTQLIEQPFFESAQLLDLQYRQSVIAGDAPLQQADIQDQRALISQYADRLSGTTDTQVFIVNNDGNVPSWSILTAVRAVSADGTSELRGYLLVTLDIETVFIDSLVPDANENELDLYAYLIVPTGAENVIIAPSNVIDDALFDVNSVGAQRALSNRASSVSIYDVGDDETTRRQVAGYTSTITIDNQQFALVTEANTSTAFNVVRQQFIGQAFVFGLAFTIFVVLIGLLVANQLVIPPIRNLRDAILAVIRGDFDTPVNAVTRGDELGDLATSFVDLREYTRDLITDMERRLQDRTRDVQITQNIAKTVTSERDLNKLMTQVVTLITDNFSNIYHAQIFMVDGESKYAVLRASTGSAGKELLARGHKLGVGSVSVIGQVTEQGQVIVARDTAESNVHRQNEFLSETRAELAIPLRLGDKIIGALDVQSKQSNSFDADEIATLETLADQITIAIENARLYTESERLLTTVQAERARETRRAWQQYLYQQRQSDLLVTSGVHTGYDFDLLREQVLTTGEAVVGKATDRNTIPFVVPVKLRDQVLGVIEYEVPEGEFEYNKVLLAQELVARLGISLENARLFQASQQATERERMVNDISTKLTSQTDIESILETAIREIEQALRTPQVAIRLGDAITSDGYSSNGNGYNAYPNGNHPDDTAQ
ncbi:MAG: GAF domain-containing protein [Anaerolineae bacterium]